MTAIKRGLAVLLCCCLMLGAAACGGAVGGYRIIATMGSEEYAIGFRNDDFLRLYFEAAIYTLSAEGVMSAYAMRWFYEDTTYFPEDLHALEKLGAVPPREIIIGASPDTFPVSYQDENGNFMGYDIDIARAVCDRLGWTVTFLPIRAEDAYVELSSGNVDVAWGGLALDQGSRDYTVISPYLKNEFVLVSRSDSKFSSKGRLKGATLAIDVHGRYMDMLNTDPAFVEKLGQVKRINGGVPALFTALSTTQTDAILVNRLAVQHYSL